MLWIGPVKVSWYSLVIARELSDASRKIAYPCQGTLADTHRTVEESKWITLIHVITLS